MHDQSQASSSLPSGGIGDGLLLSTAGALTAGYWLPALIESPTIGFGLGEVPVADWVRIVLLIGHVISAPIAYVVALVVLSRRGRRLAFGYAAAVVPAAVGAAAVGTFGTVPWLVAAGPAAFVVLMIIAATVVSTRPQDRAS